MKIALNVSPLQNDHKNRGTGSYAGSLLSSLKTIKNNNLEIKEFVGQVPSEVDLIHYPFFDPFFLTLPLVKSKSTVVTVHDLIPLKFPDRFPRGIRGEIKWQIQKYSLIQSQAIITDSKSSANDIHLITGFAKEKIYVIPLAVNKIYRPITDKNILERIKTKYNLPESFILYVGDVNWNKNIAGLLTAFAEIRKQSRDYSSNEVRSSKNSSRSPAENSNDKALSLALVGSAFKNDLLPETKEINRLIDELQIDDSILKLGFVAEEDLADIYNLAKAYVQPSFYEGFGLPVLEALSCGCLVVCSNISSLPEVGGDAVLYFDPENTDDMIEKISGVLHYDTAQYHSVQKKGFNWVKNFSWEKTAQETIKVYEKILKS